LVLARNLNSRAVRFAEKRLAGMDAQKPVNETAGNNSHAALRVNETGRSAKRPTLTKKLVMSLPTGTFVAPGVLGGLYRNRVTGANSIGPSWMGNIQESREARQAQWEEIKACRANGRAIWIIEGPDEISDEARMLLGAEKLPEESLYTLAGEIAKARKTAAADSDGEVPF
jgi:hypothetical protein